MNTIFHGALRRPMSRRSLDALSGHGDPGKFGRMFPELDPLSVEDDALFALAEALVDDNPQDKAGDNPSIPAGFTYLGQFVDHDLTLDTTPLSQQDVDPLATMNFRSPALDMDSVYGQGPGVSPHLYARDPATFQLTNKFLIGVASESTDQNNDRIDALPNDLPRNRVGRALIGDERNDENLLIAQTHLTFLKFHNKVIDFLEQTNGSLSKAEQFQEARRLVTWHYQWIVLYDFVERLTEPGLINKIRHEGRRFYRFRSRPYMPAEFSAAAYRLGHSMVRQQYDHNRVFRTGGLAAGDFSLLFGFTGKSGAIIGDLVDDPSLGNPGPVPPQRDLPSSWIIDWRRFYDLDIPAPGVTVNATRKLDPLISPELHTLPGEADREKVLPFRNLKRGVNLGLPSGQNIAKAMGVRPLSQAQLTTGPDGAVLKAHGMHRQTPLWYYVLKEAQALHDGNRLGPVGSLIIAETFLGLVHGDHNSFMWRRSNWTPELPSKQKGDFTMADLLRFVDDINPIG